MKLSAVALVGLIVASCASSRGGGVPLAARAAPPLPPWAAPSPLPPPGPAALPPEPASPADRK